MHLMLQPSHEYSQTPTSQQHNIAASTP